MFWFNYLRFLSLYQQMGYNMLNSRHTSVKDQWNCCFFCHFNNKKIYLCLYFVAFYVDFYLHLVNVYMFSACVFVCSCEFVIMSFTVISMWNTPKNSIRYFMFCSVIIFKEEKVCEFLVNVNMIDEFFHTLKKTCSLKIKKNEISSHLVSSSITNNEYMNRQIYQIFAHLFCHREVFVKENKTNGPKTIE